MSFETFKETARPIFGTVSGNADRARVAVTGKRMFAKVAALAEQHGGVVAPDTGRYPQLMSITFQPEI